MSDRGIILVNNVGRCCGWVWRFAGGPFVRLIAMRAASAIHARVSISYERIACCVFVAVVLACASQAISPAANHDSAFDDEDPLPVVTVLPRDRVKDYVWLSKSERNDFVPLVDYLAAPQGYTRISLPQGGFADWLRHLPIAPVGTPVTGSNRKTILAGDSALLAAVIALQPRSGRALSGVNMLIRLRAEHAWAVGDKEAAAFHFTSGHFMPWSAWAEGVRPTVVGRDVKFKKSAETDDSRSNFCAYLETVFNYTSALSILDDTRPPNEITVAAGDIFLPREKNAAPLMVLDAVTDGAGDVRVLLGRAGIPAQTFHVIRGSDGLPWFDISQSRAIEFDGLHYEAERIRRWVR